MSRHAAQWLPAIALTGALLTGSLIWDPFSHLRAAMNRSAPELERAKVTRYFSDPGTQEVSNGQHPLASLRQLEIEWCGHRSDMRYILSGNSQTMTVVLAPGEVAAPQAAKTYPDLLLKHLGASGFSGQGYRLSAPNLSYVEVLWYLMYLTSHPCVMPNELVIQLNFETFRKTGIRDGMLELLDDPRFSGAVEQEAHASAAYSGVLQQAIAKHQLNDAQRSGDRAAGAQTSRTGLAEAAGLGGFIESFVRERLNGFTAFKTRGVMKSELLDIVYLMRVNVLGITPATKRSLGGGTLTSNLNALKRIGELCRAAGIRLVYFNAPQNPAAPLYRTPADREQYRQMIARIAQDADAYFDFEDSIPASMWGVWVDGPDPIHFGRAGHQRLADLMFDSKVIASAP